MPNEQTTLIKVAVGAALFVGPFRGGKVYAVPVDVGALILADKRFAPATLAEKQDPAPLTGEHNEHFEWLRAKKRAADEAEKAKAAAAAKAKAEAAAASKPTPAAAGNNGG